MQNINMTKAPVCPHLTVKDVEKAAAFYETAFGFKTSLKLPGQNGTAMHAQVEFKGGTVMIGPENAERGMLAPASSGMISPVSIYIQVADVDSQHRQAVAAGGKELLSPMDQFYGARTSIIMDPDGHQWMLAKQKTAAQDDASVLNAGRFKMVNA